MMSSPPRSPLAALPPRPPHTDMITDHLIFIAINAKPTILMDTSRVYLFQFSIRRYVYIEYVRVLMS